MTSDFSRFLLLIPSCIIHQGIKEFITGSSFK
jgi:hypothetical protein